MLHQRHMKHQQQSAPTLELATQEESKVKLDSVLIVTPQLENLNNIHPCKGCCGFATLQKTTTRSFTLWRRPACVRIKIAPCCISDSEHTIRKGYLYRKTHNTTCSHSLPTPRRRDLVSHRTYSAWFGGEWDIEPGQSPRASYWSERRR